MSKRKGASGENEFARWLRDALDLEVTPKRNLEQTRSGGADIIDVRPYCIEVKRQERVDCYSFWCQCVEASSRLPNNPIPIVAFRKNHQKWQFLISASFLLDHLPSGYIRLTEAVFRSWIRDHYRWWNEHN